MDAARVHLIVHYLPTIDGPSHVYNASILLRLLTGNGGRFDDYNEID